MHNLFDAFGWIGAGLLLFAYYLSIKNKEGRSAYQLPSINLLGSVLLMINAIYFKVYPFVLVNVFWAILSLRELIKLSGSNKK